MPSGRLRLRHAPVLSALLPLLFFACGGPSQPASPGSTITSKSSALPSSMAAWSASASTSSSVAAAEPPVDPDVPSGADATRDAALAVDAGALFDVFWNQLPRLTPDGKKVVFRSNRDGIPQLYVSDVAKPDAAPTRLVTTTERIVDFELLPDGKSVLFRSDKGADENWSIFQVALEGTGLKELTPGDSLDRDPPLVPTGAADTFVYSARSVKEKTARVYVQKLDGSVPKLAYTDPSTSFLTSVSPDGKWALMVRLASLSDAKLLLVDLGSGTAKTIYPAEGKTVGLHDAQFSSDGSTIYVSTDGGGEDALLLALDAKTATEKARYLETKPKTASIGAIAVPRHGDKIALTIDAGNHVEIRILDGKTLKRGAAPSMPLGSGGALSMSDDGKTATLQWSTPSAPQDAFAIDVQTGAVRALRKEKRDAVAKLPPLEASITEVTSFDGMKVPVNLYLPKGLIKDGKKKLPTIVIVHGGPASSYEVRWGLFNRFYSAHGFAIVEPNIRGSSGFGRAYEQGDDGSKRMDAVRDTEEVGKWASQQPWADASRLVLLGGSYGGYMTLMGVTHHPTLWKAGVDLFGIYSWRAFMTTTAGYIRDIFQKEIGPESDGAFLDSISPSASIDQAVAPLFVYAGQNDPRVPRSESDAIVKNLRARKVPVEYMVAANEGHSLDRRENVVAFLSRSERFLEGKLRIEIAK